MAALQMERNACSAYNATVPLVPCREDRNGQKTLLLSDVKKLAARCHPGGWKEVEMEKTKMTEFESRCREVCVPAAVHACIHGLGGPFLFESGCSPIASHVSTSCHAAMVLA